MTSAIPLFRDVYFKARKERREIVAIVLMANDERRKVRFGPRGGWRFMK